MESQSNFIINAILSKGDYAMSRMPTPAEADKFLSLFFDLELVNEQLVENSDFGKLLETTRLRFIDLLKGKNGSRKFYHISLYENGYIAHYGRLDDSLEPQYKSSFHKKFPYWDKARRAYENKVWSKLHPPSGKDQYDLVGVEKHEY